MITGVVAVLQNLKEVLEQLEQAAYIKPCENLDNATIGGHTRHIIELFQGLINGYANGVVNYDARKRDMLLETDVMVAVNAIDSIIKNLKTEDKPLMLVQQIGEKTIDFSTNYYRELLYNVEHCIHHQALIRVALKSVNAIKVNEQFGVAFATLNYRQQCAQ